MSDRTLEESRWANAIERATFGAWDLDPRLDVVHYSPRWKARLGFPRIDAPDSSAFWRCRVHPDDLDPMLRSLRAHFDGCSSTYEMRFRLRCTGSGYRTVLSRGRVVVRDSSGSPTRMIGTMVDLTGRPPRPWRPNSLATEEQLKDEAPRLPFHAALGVVRPIDGMGGSSGAQDDRRLVEMICDLLDIAAREADAAP